MHHTLDLFVRFHFSALGLPLADKKPLVSLAVKQLLYDLFPFLGGEEHGGGASVLGEDYGAVGLGCARYAVRERVAELAHRDDVFGWFEIEHGIPPLLSVCA